ncbi:class I SAM-dependent methyltransferase [Pseudokineococcus basanitobsidens]|uniref:Class I SAM-dependent methyltransferase n=1 Tax=Pseudokineococcus basanitobsidens TaxID=1926649 RepID=A0ABU8RMX9_9ACTN
MDRAALSDIAHRRHPVAAPVDPGRVRELLGWLAPPAGGRVLDLGSGYGAWLLELLAVREHLTGVGIDLSLPESLARAIPDNGVVDRVRWEEADATGWDGGLFDIVVCVGASHAFGGLAGTLEAVRRHLRPGGQVVLGDVFWEIAPTPAAMAALEAAAEDVPDLPGLLAEARSASFEPGFGHVSTLTEWDEYEWSWTGSLVDWALREAPTDADREQALAAAREHRQQWLDGYRGVLGFATLVLHDIAPPQDTRS